MLFLVKKNNIVEENAVFGRNFYCVAGRNFDQTIDFCQGFPTHIEWSSYLQNLSISCQNCDGGRYIENHGSYDQTKKNVAPEHTFLPPTKRILSAENIPDWWIFEKAIPPPKIDILESRTLNPKSGSFFVKIHQLWPARDLRVLELWYRFKVQNEAETPYFSIFKFWGPVEISTGNRFWWQNLEKTPQKWPKSRISKEIL